MNNNKSSWNKASRLLAIVMLLTFSILSSKIAYATGWPRNFARDIFVYLFLLPTALIGGWIAVHSVGNRKSFLLLLMKSIIDLAVILPFAVLFSFFVTQSSWKYPYGDGLWKPIVQGEYFFYTYKLVLLLIVVMFAIYSLNKSTSDLPKLGRLVMQFCLSFLVMIGILTVFEPSISGAFTRWFIDRGRLETSLGHKIHHSIYKGQSSPGHYEYDDVTWAQYYGFDKR